MPFVWTEDLAVGVKVVDMQHQELFKRINSLVEAVEGGSADTEIEGLFGFLETYVDSHFTTEEKAMTVYEYPERKSHKIQHAIFVESIEDIKEKFHERGVDSELTAELHYRVCDWLVSHVSKVDKELGAYLKDKI